MKKTKVSIFLLLCFFYLLPLTAAGEGTNSSKLRVVTELANIRQRPDIGSEVIRQVPLGTILQISGKEGDWYFIRLETKEGEPLSGYIHESLVVKLEPHEKKEEKAEKREVEEEQPITQPPPLPTVSAKPIFTISASGGGNYVVAGDLNRGANGFVQFFREELGLEGNREPGAVHLSYIFGGELSIPILPQLYLGIGVDYLQGEKKSSMEYRKGSTPVTLSTLPEIRATPLRAFLAFYPLPSIYLKGGIEYYFAGCSYFYSIQDGKYWKKWQGKATAKNLGLLGGLGVEWNLSSNLVIFMEADGRYARIKGFKGKDVSRDSKGLEYTEEGTLYFYQAIADNKSFPQLFIREKIPAEAWVLDPREALIDFSGFSLRLGIRIKI